MNKIPTKQTPRVRYLCACLTLLALSHAAVGQAPPPADLSSEEVVARVAPSVAVVLTGAGAGRLSGVGSGVIVRSDGILLTAYHVIKDAREVQVRLKTGEIYDRVELVAVDERRDVAALRIPAANLPALAIAPLDEARLGEPVSVVSNPSGPPEERVRSWSAVRLWKRCETTARLSRVLRLHRAGFARFERRCGRGLQGPCARHCGFLEARAGPQFRRSYRRRIRASQRVGAYCTTLGSGPAAPAARVAAFQRQPRA